MFLFFGPNISKFILFSSKVCSIISWFSWACIDIAFFSMLMHSIELSFSIVFYVYISLIFRINLTLICSTYSIYSCISSILPSSFSAATKSFMSIVYSYISSISLSPSSFSAAIMLFMSVF